MARHLALIALPAWATSLSAMAQDPITAQSAYDEGLEDLCSVEQRRRESACSGVRCRL
jgi:hypothetical protein